MSPAGLVRPAGAGRHRIILTTLAGAEIVWLGGDGAAHGVRGRRLRTPWRDTDLAGGGPLRTENLSGALTKSAGFSQTICTVAHEAYALRRINAQPSDLAACAKARRADLERVMALMLADLHPTDFEVLVDQIFTRSGWRRLTAVGGAQADYDFIAEQPLTGMRAMVQVKAAARQRVLDDYVERFKESGLAQFYFACHSIEGARLVTSASNVTLLLREELAARALDCGLYEWLLARTR